MFTTSQDSCLLAFIFIKLLAEKLGKGYLPQLSCTNLYTNTVLDGSVILCVCSFAIDANNFPLSNLQAKHIFGSMKTIWGSVGVPKFIFYFFYRRRSRPRWGAEGAQIFLLLLAETPPVAAVSQIGAEGTPNVTPKAAASRVYWYTWKRH